VVKTVFNQRRKMLRVSLKQLVNDLSSVSDHPFMTLRPEQLTIPQFVELTNLVEKLLSSQDGKAEK
jgi:16S rRNA (adenine1518-N6/adenine1519-N6)-dimethyltransferase